MPLDQFISTLIKVILFYATLIVLYYGLTVLKAELLRK